MTESVDLVNHPPHYGNGPDDPYEATNGSKQCSECEQIKNLIEFPPDNRRRDGRGSKCRPCADIIERRFYSKYPEKEAERRLKNAQAGAAWYRRNRSREIKRMKWNRILRLFGITEKQYIALLHAQNGRCAICNSTDPGRGDGHFSIDHDHETQTIRGLLCVKCNVGIGHFDDDVQRMQRAIEYVTKGRKSNNTATLHVLKTGTD